MSCNSVDKKDLTIIDNLQLGESISGYDSLRSNLNIETKDFYTKNILTEEDDPQSNTVSFPVTENFNFSQYRSSTNKLSHFGLLHPVVLSGTDNIVSLIVLLAHTEIPTLNTMDYYKRLPENLLTIKQLVASDIIKQVEDMYTSKYGKPTTSSSSSLFLNF